MKYRLIIRPEAEAEIQEAFDWYERRVPSLGAKFFATRPGGQECLVI